MEVAELAALLAASEVTIRRDLDQLALTGVLRRVHGGAVSTLLRGEGQPYAMREPDAAAVKARMAAAAQALLVQGEAVVLDSGTTGEAVARALRPRRLTVMPFSIQAIAALAGAPEITLHLPGGTVRPEEGSVVGPLAESALRDLRFDTAIISCCAASAGDGLLAYDLQDAAVKRGMIASSRRVIAVAEGAKFRRSAMAVICALDTLDVLITDAAAPPEALEELRAAGVEVIVV